jgi:ADP-heptose:LPS heptosyltransferase
MQSGKNHKILGVSYGVTGDLIMGLPVLTYFEKKYPGSYKYWFIEKKCANSAPLYFNHPLIDCIRITGEWSGFSNEDYKIANECETKCTMMNWRHDELDWYNHRGQIEETARIAGIKDLKDVLTEEEMYPKLYQWFDVGHEDDSIRTYSKENKVHTMDDTIAIWPGATAGGGTGRSPSDRWWSDLTEKIKDMGYIAMQFGYRKDRNVGYLNRTGLSFFEQVKIALSCKMSIGTDSGNMWVMGAYSHPAIHLMTNWLPGHTQNFSSLTPVNKNGIELFAEGNTDNISHSDVIGEVVRIMNG